MEQTTHKAKVKSTGKEVTVYKHKATGRWVDYSDCTTMYDESDLIFTQH